MFHSGTWAAFCRLIADETGASEIEFSMVALGMAIFVGAAAWFIGPEIKQGIYDRLLALL